MARRGAPNEDLSNIEFETSEEVEVVPTFNSMVSVSAMNAHFHSHSPLTMPIKNHTFVHFVLFCRD